ncbi:U-box domain-containing protein 34 [Tanacetum coccineum]
MLSYDSIEDAKRINSAVECEEKFWKIAAEEKEKHLEAIKEKPSEKQQIVDALFTNVKRYRRYTIDEIEVATKSFSKAKVVGEGAYGKVYKCNPDHTPVAIKVLWSDTSEKKREFL